MEKILKTVSVDSRGRIILPQVVREFFRIYESDTLMIECDEDVITLKRCSELSFFEKQAEMAVSTIKNTYKEISEIICFDKKTILASKGNINNFEIKNAFNCLTKNKNEIYLTYKNTEYFIVPVYIKNNLACGLAVNVIKDNDLNYDIEICVRSTAEFLSNIMSK